jgi:carboxymethylenebutenolidase
MPRLTAKDFHPEVLRLFDQYVHGLIPRRGFLQSASAFAAGVGAAELLDMLNPRFAEAQQVRPDDPRLVAHNIEVESPQGSGIVRCYLAQPAAKEGHDGEKRPIVLVVHENRGLNPHIEDIARRLALDGFVALAPDALTPDALTPLGSYPGDEDRARELFGKLDQKKCIEDFVAAAKYLQSLPAGNGKLGAVGFCWGGGVVNALAERLPDMFAGVPFYGVAPDLAEVGDIKAELQLHFAGDDGRVNATWPPYEAALKAAGARYEAFIYPGVQHGFNNDTTPRFDAAAAKLAWERTIALFNRTLR